MGQEADCTATAGRQSSRGRAYLETDSLLFRGKFRLEIPYSSIRTVHARNGRLIVRFSGGSAAFDLGARASSWAERIAHPKPLLDKLALKPGDRVAVLGVMEEDFLRQVRARAQSVARSRVSKGLDAIFVRVDRRTALAPLRRLRAALAPAGGLWIIAPRGVAEITEADVLAAGRKAGLVDVKVVRFSDTHTAHKFMIPRKGRL